MMGRLFPGIVLPPPHWLVVPALAGSAFVFAYFGYSEVKQSPLRLSVSAPLR